MTRTLEELREGSAPSRLRALGAIPTLGALPDTSTLEEALLACLDDTDPQIRRMTLDVVGRLGEFRAVRFGARVVDAVIARCDDTVDDVRAEAAVALALAREEGECPPRISEAAWLGPTARRIRVLRNLLGDASSRVRQEAAAALGDLGDPSVCDPLAALLADASADVRFEAAFALAALGDTRARDAIESALATGLRRLDACEAIRKLGDPDCIPALEGIAKRMFLPWADRLTVLATLYALGAIDVATRIRARTAARNSEERAYALSLIGTHHIRECADVLESVAKDVRDKLRDVAVRTLGVLGDEAHVDLLDAIASTKDNAIELRLDAIEALHAISGDRAAQRLKAHGDDSDPRIAAAANPPSAPHRRGGKR